MLNWKLLYYDLQREKKLKNIGTENIKNLQLLMERFEISTLVFWPANRYKKMSQSIYQLALQTPELKRRMTSQDAKEETSAGRKLVVVDAEDRKPCVKQGQMLVLTYEDIYNILCAPKEVYAPIPAMMNTLENIYATIGIVGEGAYAEKLKQYFKENESIRLHQISEENMVWKEDGYLLKEEIAEDEIVIFADLYADFPVSDQNGRQVQTLFLKKIYKTDLKTTEYLQDISENIIPKLTANGVHVLKVYIADMDRLTEKSRVEEKMLYWKVQRKLDEDKFFEKRYRQAGTEYLLEEQKKLVNENIKGYSEVHGNGTYINFDNGFRRTIGNTPGVIPGIYFFGPCFIRGTDAPDEKTIPSLVKEMIGKKFNVYNYGSEFHTCNYIMRTLEYRKGDIVVFFSSEEEKNDTKKDPNIQYMDLTDIYNQIPNLEQHVFDLPEHFDLVVGQKIAESVYEKLNEAKFLEGSDFEPERVITFGPARKRVPELEFGRDQVFADWVRRIKENYPWDGKKRGAIVMNCNPFTLGHRYLIETVAKRVEELFIFVVQEDKSIFPFDDRLELVKKGTADLLNVHVLPSGNYMISSMTLPGYFNKDELGDTVLDASMDLILFLQIAKELHITERFVGEEPLDPFTRQYNENMQRIFPKYGMELSIIPRKTEEEEVISASRVRRALKAGDFELIKRLVPETTYEYLVNMKKDRSNEEE